jgi:hypothetical protein
VKIDVAPTQSNESHASTGHVDILFECLHHFATSNEALQTGTASVTQHMHFIDEQQADGILRG